MEIQEVRKIQVAEGLKMILDYTCRLILNTKAKMNDAIP